MMMMMRMMMMIIIMVMILVMMIVMTILYRTVILLTISSTGTHSQIYTDSHRYRHTDAHTYERTRTCSHTHTLSVCMHTLSFKLINMDGNIYTHTMYSRKTVKLSCLTYTYNYIICKIT